MSESLGFIGLGGMGQPMALNLAGAGHSLRVWNRTSAKAAVLVRQGATLAPESGAVALAGGIVFTSLADDHALEEICLTPGSFVEKLGTGGVHVSMSTISPATAQKLAEHHAKHGVSYVASPVFGRPEAAAAKKLWVCLSGPAAAKQRVKPFLGAIGQGNFDFGEDPGGAHVAKLCGNFLLMAAIEAMAEAFALAEKNGVNSVALAEMLGQTLFACTAYQGYGKRIAEGEYMPPGFRLLLGLKDAKLVMQTAESSRTPMPVASLVHDRFLSALAKGRENMDWSAFALNAAEEAGITKYKPSNMPTDK